MRRALALVVLFLAGCGQSAPRVDPPLYTYDTPALTRISAEAHARDVGGRAWNILDTRSMEPLLVGGDRVVVAPEPFDAQKLLGRVVLYWPDWKCQTPVVHRGTAADGYGLIVSGDNVRPQIDANGRNQVSEASYRVTAANYLGVVVGIYRTKQ